MKKKDLPQDQSALENFTREVCYVKNEKGEYEKALSSGWKTKADALENAWEEVDRRVEKARQEVAKGEKSPIYYFLEKNLMDMQILAGYTGFWQFTIKRHLRPDIFKKLSDSKLRPYAKAFKISVEELKNFDPENVKKL